MLLAIQDSVPRYHCAGALFHHRLDGTQDRGESILRTARGSGDGCLPVLWSALEGGAHDEPARPPTARRGVSLSRPWGLVTTVPMFPVATHPEQWRPLVAGILTGCGTSVSGWLGSAQPVAFLCHVRRPAME